MDGFGPATYGDRIADLYDEWHEGIGDTDQTVEFLAALADGGPVLELGVGTGRVALPLAARGIEVVGIEGSEAMAAKLKEKEGGEAVRVFVGDFADTAVEGTFRVIFAAFNTFLLPTQEAQARCFENGARHLDPGGAVVVDALVPHQGAQGDGVKVLGMGLDHVLLLASRYDPTSQQQEMQYILIREEGVRLVPMLTRLSSPSELDFMARVAGLRVRERWGGWRREPFVRSSMRHVSVYERV